jgi:hypothetical protein
MSCISRLTQNHSPSSTITAKPTRLAIHLQQQQQQQQQQQMVYPVLCCA